MSETSSDNDELKTALADLASLGRVGHRLAMLDSCEKLQSVLDKLLSRLLERIGSNNQKQLLATGRLKDTLQKIHQKLVEILSHAMKRVRDERTCKLNCSSILNLLLDENYKAKAKVNAFTINLSLAFLTLGIRRCDESESRLLLPGLIVLNGFYSLMAATSAGTTPTIRSHWHQISHLLIRTLEGGISQEQEQNRFGCSIGG